MMALSWKRTDSPVPIEHVPRELPKSKGSRGFGRSIATLPSEVGALNDEDQQRLIV
jgi:hypothetical protein